MPASSLLRRPALTLILGLGAIAGVTTLLGRLTNGPQIQTKPVALSGVDGVAAYPAFSRDGNRLAYCERGTSKDDAFHLFVRRLPTGTPTQLTTGAANDISPAWSPDGSRIAFLRVEEGKARCLVVPADGGAEKQIAEFGAADVSQTLPALSWSHDGQTLAAVTGGDKQAASIALISVSNGGVRRVTTPPEGQDDWSPAFSPDGSKLAFARGQNSESADLYLADANGGNPRRLTIDQSNIRGLAWANGNDLVFASTRGNGIRLYRIAVNGGSPREVMGTGNQSRYPAISPAAHRLAYTDSPMVTSVWRAPLGAGAAGGERPILRSGGRESLPSYSPDGKRIANVSDQSGFDEIWVSDADGGNRIELTDSRASDEHPQFGRAAWSPDGKWLLFDRRTDGSTEVWKMQAAAGSKPVRVLTGGAHGATWARSGKSVYYVRNGQIWKANADGGQPEQLTERGGGGSPTESADGKFLYFRMRGASVWRVPIAGGEAEEVFGADGPMLGDPQPTKNGVYYLTFDRFDRSMAVSFFDFATKKPMPVYRMRARDVSFSGSFAVSPDEKSILFSRVDQSQTNVMLVENFQ